MGDVHNDETGATLPPPDANYEDDEGAIAAPPARFRHCRPSPRPDPRRPSPARPPTSPTHPPSLPPTLPVILEIVGEKVTQAPGFFMKKKELPAGWMKALEAYFGRYEKLLAVMPPPDLSRVGRGSGFHAGWPGPDALGIAVNRLLFYFIPPGGGSERVGGFFLRGPYFCSLSFGKKPLSHRTCIDALGGGGGSMVNVCSFADGIVGGHGDKLSVDGRLCHVLRGHRLGDLALTALMSITYRSAKRPAYAKDFHVQIENDCAAALAEVDRLVAEARAEQRAIDFGRPPWAEEGYEMPIEDLVDACPLTVGAGRRACILKAGHNGFECCAFAAELGATRLGAPFAEVRVRGTLNLELEGALAAWNGLGDCAKCATRKAVRRWGPLRLSVCSACRKSLDKKVKAATDRFLGDAADAAAGRRQAKISLAPAKRPRLAGAAPGADGASGSGAGGSGGE